MTEEERELLRRMRDDAAANDDYAGAGALDAALNETEPDKGPCDAETWSWDHFRPGQVDAYWIRCSLLEGHDGDHKDSGNTGLSWSGS